MRTKKLLSVVLALMAISAVTALAAPVELYLVKFAPGTDVYRLAGSQNWPVYHISGQQALVGKQLSKSDNKTVLGSNQIYRGPSENLKWVHLKRNSQLPAIKIVYSGKDMLLAESGNVTAAGVKSGRDYMVKSFSSQPMPISPAAIIRNTSLVRDTAVAALTHLIDTAQVRTRIEALQSFDTRFLDAANHDSVVGWIRNQFLDMGITDVILDTFNIGFGPKQHNIIATIPGLLDTSVVYIVGGHYDSYSDRRDYSNDTIKYYLAPGADDNASGTVAALEMARVLSQPGNRPNCTVRFIAFDAEEYGLFGSEYYAQQALAEGMDIGCMLNYDMIGYKGNDSIFVSKLYPGSEGYAYMLGQMAGWYGRTADTNLAPVYNSVYLNGSDSWEFSIRGFPVTYSEEDIFSTVYHQTNDSTTYMSIRYVTSIIKAGMGFLGTLSNYPQKVNGLTITDVGNGAQLYAQWQPNQAGNVTGYKIYLGKSSGIYTDTMQVTGASYTIGGLMADSLYYIGIIAIDDSSKESPVITEATGTPKAAPLAPSGLTATPVDSGISLAWKKNLELDLAGYNVYRRIDSGSLDSLTATADTFLLNKPLSGASRYYYKIQAKDVDGNKGPMSDSAYCRPITLDQGILVVDETQNWTSGNLPRDTTQDRYWDDLLAGYSHQQYEYGTTAQRPCEGDYAPYSTIVWHGDDYSQLMANVCVTDLKSYLDHGGRLWLVGWKPTADLTNGTVDNLSFGPGSFMYDWMKVSGMSRSLAADSFQAAVGKLSYPDISVDPAKVPLVSWGGTMRYIEKLTPVSPAEGIYDIDMKNNSSSFEGQNCGVRYLGSDFKTALLGFPLYFMDKAQAKAVAQKIMDDFGEINGVSGKPDDKIASRDFRLSQNAPNPFAQLTIISYQLAKSGLVNLKVYNITGQTVKTLVNSVQSAGSYDIKWDGRDDNGLQVSNGVYVYKLETGVIKSTRKMLLLR